MAVYMTSSLVGLLLQQEQILHLISVKYGNIIEKGLEVSLH